MAPQIRKAYESEARECAELIYLSGAHIYRYSMIQGAPKIYEFFEIFYNHSGTIYSRENVVVEEEDGRIRGLLLAFPARDMGRMAGGMMKCLKEMAGISGLGGIIKMFFRMKLNRYMPGTGKDEFFLSNLAVLEEYRGKGIGLGLLNKAEEMAREKNLKSLSLYVEIDNSRARKIYERFGFHVVKEVVLPKGYNKHGLFGFRKMVKEIGGK